MSFTTNCLLPSGAIDTVDYSVCADYVELLHTPFFRAPRRLILQARGSAWVHCIVLQLPTQLRSYGRYSGYVPRGPDGQAGLHLAPAWNCSASGIALVPLERGAPWLVATRLLARLLAVQNLDYRPPTSFVPRTQTHRSQLPPDDEADISRIRPGCPIRRPCFGNSIDLQACRQREGLLLCQQPGQGPEDRILLRRTTHHRVPVPQKGSVLTTCPGPIRRFIRCRLRGYKPNRQDCHRRAEGAPGRLCLHW